MNSDLRNRIFITVGLLAFSRLLLHIPLPGIDFSEVAGFLGFGLLVGTKPVVGMLGIYPYLVASTIVTMFVYLRTRLREADDRRLPLELYTLLLTAVFALPQAYVRATFFESLYGLGGDVVPDPGLAFRLTAMLSMTAGAFLFVWIARMITRHGIGNGVCLLLVATMLTHLFGYARVIGKEILTWGHRAPGAAVGFLAVAVVVFLIIIWLVHSRWRVPTEADDANEEARRPLLLHVNPVGVAGYYLAFTVIGVILAFGRMMPWSLEQKMVELTEIGGVTHWIVLAVLTFLGTYWLAALAYDPQGLKRTLDRCQPNSDSAIVIDQKRFDRNLGFAATLVAVLILVICVLLSWHAARYELKFAVVGLFPLTAISIDTFRQYRQRARLAAPGDTTGRESTCSDCGGKVRDEVDYCDHCGASFDDGEMMCAEHGDQKANAACIICGKTLCEECAFVFKGRYTCDDHSIVELMHGWATVATVRTQIEAELCRRRLDGIPAQVFSNTVEPMYGTFGLFDINPVTPLLVYREIGGGQIRILVPVRDWIKAREALEMTTEML